MQVYSRKSKSLRSQSKWKMRTEHMFSPQHSFQLLAVASGVIAVACLIYIAQWATFFQIGYRSQSLQREHDALSRRLELLEIEVSYLSRLERLEKVALSDGRMIYPKPSQIRTLTDRPPE